MGLQSWPRREEHDVSKPECAGRKGDRITFYGHPEIGEKRAVEICKRLRRSRDVWDRVGYLVRNHLRTVSAREMRRSTLRRFLSEDGIDELLALCRLDALASSGDLSSYEYCIEQLAMFDAEPLRPEPLINGRDLLERGWKPGPHLGKMLRAVEDQQLEGEIVTREEALAWVQQHADPSNSPEKST